MKRSPVLAVLVPLLALAPELAAQASVDIREWPVPYADSRPRDPYVDAGGRVWFVGQEGNYVAYLDPASGQFRRYELEERALPHNLVVAPDGAVWYAGNGNGHIGRLDPATGQVRRFAMPDSAARDPHTLVFDRGGDLWFTVQGGNFVGRLAPATGEVRLIPSATPRSRPYGIVIDGQSRVWLNLFGTNKLAMVDPQTMRMEEIALPRADARTRRIGLTTDGSVWYVDYAKGMLGRYDPRSREFREWALPGGDGSRPYAMAVDDQDRIWAVETGARPNRVVGFDPRTGEFFSSTPIESGGGAVRHMVFHAPSREIWFGTDTNTIGRVKVP
jgi:virginiamycin B lyase